MKIVHDNDLSALHTYTQPLAKRIASFTSDNLIQQILRVMKHDERIQELTYSGMMTFINTIGSHILCALFLFSCDIGRKWPDVDHSSREIFEEIIEGLRVYLNFQEISKEDYAGEIKKIKVEDIK